MTKFSFTFIALPVLLYGCWSHLQPGDKDSMKNVAAITQNSKNSLTEDSVKLTDLVKRLYKWHVKDTTQVNGFKAVKQNPADTLSTSIDLNENKKAIAELKQTGLFTDDFLNDYRKIAVRMDKELRDGSSLWPDGQLSTFGDDTDEWWNCEDSPIEDYWKIIKLADIKIANNEANFKWTWGGNKYYKVKAKKENEEWKISYLQGFDMDSYTWGWVTNHKK